MGIDSGVIAELRDLTPEDDIAAFLPISKKGFSIGAVVELACVRKHCSSQVRTLLDTWASSSPIFREAITVFENTRYPSRDDMWSVRGIEFFPIVGKNWADPTQYHPFESRFRKAAKASGFGDMADAFTGALFEMADNVVQHSGANSAGSFIGLIGYYICDGHIAFSVGDAGRGILASLKENPTWQNIPNSKAGLLAIIEQHASRRVESGDGEGFKQVLRSIIDFNGIVEMHSHDGRVRLSQFPKGGREAISQFMGIWPGFQLSVNCSLIHPEEKIILT